MSVRQGLSMAGAALAIAISGSAALAGEAGFYGDKWYRGDFWSGEYQDGFSVRADVTMMIRAEPEPGAPRDIACALPGNATYHPWNEARNEADQARYLSFTMIDDMTIVKQGEAVVDPYEGEDFNALDLKPGDKWRYLAYFGEGAFLMEHEGEKYVGYQDLFDISEGTLPRNGDYYHEWLNLKCANGVNGWLFMADIEGVDEIEAPRIVRWGIAIDLDKPAPPEENN